MPVEAIAHHLLKSDAPASALPYLIKAGDRAAAIHAHEDALRYYRQALPFADFSATTLLHEKSGDQLGMTGKELESAACYEKALTMAGPADAPRLKRQAAYRYTLAGELDNAWKHLETRTAEPPGERNLEWVRRQYVLAHYYWQRNQFDRALTIARETLEVAEALGVQDEVARAYEMMALCCVPLGEWQQGLEYEAQRLSRLDLNRYLTDVSDVHL